MANTRIRTAIKDVGYVANNKTSGMKNIGIASNSVIIRGVAVACTGNALSCSIEIFSRATPGSTYGTVSYVALLAPTLVTGKHDDRMTYGEEAENSTRLPIAYVDSDALQQLHFDLLTSSGCTPAAYQVTWFYQIAERPS